MKLKLMKMDLIKDGLRSDGRKFDELRPIKCSVGVLKNADGSAMFKIGNTIAVAGVYGPRKVLPRHEENSQSAILRTKYNMSPFSTTERIRPGPNRRSSEISFVTREALKSVIFLEEFPKTAIDVHIEVINADASTRCAGINAASMALADSGVPMKDLVSSCSAGKVQDTIILDVAGKEDTIGDLDLPVAYYPNKNLFTLIQMDGLSKKEEIKKLIELAKKGCIEIYEKQKTTLKESYNLKGD